MGKIICGIQQMGIGVPNVENSWAWYRKNFGVNVKIFEEAAEAPLMTKYTCLLYTSPSPRDRTRSRMPSSA